MNVFSSFQEGFAKRDFTITLLNFKVRDFNNLGGKQTCYINHSWIRFGLGSMCGIIFCKIESKLR